LQVTSASKPSWEELNPLLADLKASAGILLPTCKAEVTTDCLRIEARSDYGDSSITFIRRTKGRPSSPQRRMRS